MPLSVIYSSLQMRYHVTVAHDVVQYHTVMQVLQLSREGLQRRGKSEEKFLDPLLEIAESGVTMADSLLQRFERDWGQSVDPLYSPEFTY